MQCLRRLICNLYAGCIVSYVNGSVLDLVFCFQNLHLLKRPLLITCVVYLNCTRNILLDIEQQINDIALFTEWDQELQKPEMVLAVATSGSAPKLKFYRMMDHSNIVSFIPL